MEKNVMFQPTWEHPLFIPEHKVVDSEDEFRIDEKCVRGVIKDSVKVEKYREFSVVTLSIVVKKLLI